MLNKKKCSKAALPNANPAGRLSVVDNNDTCLGLEDQPGPSNVVDTSDTLIGLEDLAHGTNDCGVPFILVDGAACTTRTDLDLALSRVEQKRMEQVLKLIDSSDFTQLEDTEPPPELDEDINLSLEALAKRRAGEEERRFQQDIRDLTFWPTEDDDACTTPTITSDNNNTSIEQVIHKFEQLRGLTKQVPPSDTESPEAKPPMRPGIQRQGTFDIKRKNEGEKDSGPGIATVEAATSKKPQYRSGIPSLTSRKQPEIKCSTVRARQIANHIGDLLVEFHTLCQKEKSSELIVGSPLSYVVTIVPANGVSNCSIVPVTNPKEMRNQNQSSSNTISPLKRIKSELNSRVIGRNSSALAPLKQASPVTNNKERCRSSLLHKTPSSFINIPSPARYYQGRKRD